MEPATALGTAWSVVQLIAFVANLLDNRANGVIIGNQELQTAADTLSEYGESVSSAGEQFPEGEKDEHESSRGSQIQPRDGSTVNKKMRLICLGCCEIANELSQALVYLKTSAEREPWESFREALQCLWNDGRIKRLLTELKTHRQNLDSLILPLLISRSDSIKQDGPLMAAVMRALRSQRLTENKEHDMQKLSTALSSILAGDRERKLKRRLIKLLKFTEINHRYESISRAHMRTFEWIFDDPSNRSSADDPTQGLSPSTTNKKLRWDNFSKWICSSNGTYWITGKPGSGKSTLMRFLYEHAKTKKFLKGWAGGNELITAKFFFLISGTTMQTSRIGLLRTLLFQILQSRSGLIPKVLRRRWKACEYLGWDPRAWGWQELTDAIETVVKLTSKRFAFFIDGLDEFDGPGEELCQFVTGLARHKNVKICVASRPLLAFEEAFGQRPHLHMEDLTVVDMKIFVVENLRSSAMFTTMIEKEKPKEASQLIQETVEKSEGVFLWTRIVVQSLITGCRDGDEIEHLRVRLRALPSDLQELFKKILNRLDPEYFGDASRMFQLVAASKGVMTLGTLSFAYASLEDIVNMPFGALPQGEAKYRAEATRRRIMSRTKGLLEARGYEKKGFNTPVMYLHRTVRDYLWERRNWDDILSGTPPSFNTHISLAVSSTAFLKRIKIMKGDEGLGDLFATFVKAVNYLRKANDAAGSTHITLFEELHSVVTKHWEIFVGKQPKDSGSWMNKYQFALTYSREDDSQTAVPLSGPESFEVSLGSPFEHALRLKLQPYIDAKLKQEARANTTVTRRRIPVLLVAILQGNFELVQTLLEHGADPKEPFGGHESLWDAAQCIFLEQSRVYNHSQETMRRIKYALDVSIGPSQHDAARDAQETEGSAANVSSTETRDGDDTVPPSFYFRTNSYALQIP